MNKLLAIITIILITALSVNGNGFVLGNPVSCGIIDPTTGSDVLCTGCGANTTIQGLFTANQGSVSCSASDCSQNPGSNLNGWMCKSCHNADGANIIFSGGPFLQGTACVSSCTGGYTADANQICQPPPVPGNQVTCGEPNGSNSAICTGCGANTTIQGLFSGRPGGSPYCYVTDCSIPPGANLNGWMCVSCNGVSNANPVYAQGKLLQGTACVSSCTGGATADNNQICQLTPVPGNPVTCGTLNGLNPSNCTGCGANTTIQGLFTGRRGSAICYVTDCTIPPGANLNGWMCSSCNGASNADSAYANGPYLQGTACVASCTGGYIADLNQICQPPPVPGTSVSCGTANGSNPATCTGCGANTTIQGLFTGDSSASTCKVVDCSLAPGANLNGWMCKSCNGVTKANPAYSTGAFLQGTSCVASCTGGYIADVNQICQPPAAVPGAPVSCGTANGSNPATCTGCGANTTIQGLFAGDSSASTCKVVDCSLAPGANLNGWMCKSCNGVGKANLAYANGPFLQGTACVASCTGGYIADVNQICQPPAAVPGAPVSCGTANGSNPATCTGCGANTTIQGLFAGDSSAATCKVIDCTLAPGANLNGWMCKSCNGATNSNTAYSAGKLFSGTTCVASCPTGQTADLNNICQVSTSSLSLALALSMLLLCLIL